MVTSVSMMMPTPWVPEFAKYCLENPGIDHLGIQAEDRDELREVYGRLKEAEAPVLEQGETNCCYARSDKAWVFDPQGVAWETFYTFGEHPVYGDSFNVEEAQQRTSHR